MVAVADGGQPSEPVELRQSFLQWQQLGEMGKGWARLGDFYGGGKWGGYNGENSSGGSEQSPSKPSSFFRG